jgi:hypothetical protein
MALNRNVLMILILSLAHDPKPKVTGFNVPEIAEDWNLWRGNRVVAPDASAS